ncbi:MAG: hypothetical protein JXR25_00465 [Pontiellaceae bacterium]|nr:hypothetical protein [Pontiellaceae bacterium]MBN2783270.1 hypothetical protein [Pontiellaceae bacterium]
MGVFPMHPLNFFDVDDTPQGFTIDPIRWKYDENSFYHKTGNRWLGLREPKDAIPIWFLISLGIVSGIAVLSLFLVRFLRHQVMRQTRKIRQSEAEYQHLFENMLTAFALHEAIPGEDGRPV